MYALVVDGLWHSGRGVLAEEVATHEDVRTALDSYGKRRLNRARTLVETSVALSRSERADRRDEVLALQRKGHGGMAAPI